MAKPILMSYADWMKDTDRSKWHGQANKKRSAELILVDQQLQAYDTPQGNPSNLEFLDRFLSAWVAGKINNSGALETMRDHKQAVTNLQQQVQAAMMLFSPVPSDYAGIEIGVDLYRGNNWVPDTFKGVVVEALNTIATKPVGRKLLTELGRLATGTKKVVIEYGKLSTAAPLAIIDNASRKKVQPKLGDDQYDLQKMMEVKELIGKFVDDGHGGKDFVNAAGTGAVVTYNHEDVGDGRPKFIALAHELVHAYHYMSGSCARAANGGIQHQGNSGLMEEEMRTVGFGAYKDEELCENAIRAEHKVPLRASYSNEASFAKVTRTVG